MERLLTGAGALAGGRAVALAGISLGPVAPLGGSLLVIGWLALLAAAATRRG